MSDELAVGDTLHGFTLTRIVPLEEYDARGYELVHDKTGCRVFSIDRKDPENVFAFCFPTLPPDDTGVPHIIEHSVLAGSRKYPVKDPFLEANKRSMNTFLNAFTTPDKTVYPAASVLEQDFFNLLDVYADAVFFPLLRKETFMQEGHRIEVGENGSEVTGIVFNEMKGYRSSHESAVSDAAVSGLYPDTPYARDSGGDPLAIPELTYEGFCDFHRTHYHPSNCLVYFYGDIPLEKKLASLGPEYLDRFERATVPVAAPLQPTWTEPRRVRATSALGEGESAEQKSTVLLAWKTCGVDEVEDLLGLELLSEVMLSDSASPMAKAIIDSGIGEDVSPLSGYDSDLRQAYLAVGVRGTDPERTEDFEQFVQGTLESFADKGFDEDVVSGAVKRTEFRMREIKGGIPFGLRLLERSMRGWGAGFPAELNLRYRPVMDRVRAAMEKNPRYLSDLLRRYLVDNPHRLTVTVVPDSEHQGRIDDRIRSDLEARLAAMSPEARSTLDADLEAYTTYRDGQDSPEELAKIPALSLSDVPRSVTTIQTELVDGPTPLYVHALPSNGIEYYDFGFDLEGLPTEEIDLLPFLAKVLPAMGFDDMDYVELSRRIRLYTGGITPFLEASDTYHDAPGGAGRKRYFFIRMKTLGEDRTKALDLMMRLLSETAYDQPQRVIELLTEQRNDFRARAVGSGHVLASLRAAGRLVGVYAQDERWRGLSGYQTLNGLLGDLSGSPDTVTGRFAALARKIFTRDRIILNLTADEASLDTAADALKSAVGSLPADGGPRTQSVFPLLEDSAYEALVAPSMVNYCTLAFPAARLDQEGHAAQVLVAQILKQEYLWDSLRLKGGAYGGSASVNGAEGVALMSSYRDPRLDETYADFRAGLENFITNGVTRGHLDNAIISSVSWDVKPLSPAEAGLLGFRRRLYGMSNELRQRKRDRMLSLSPGDLVAQAKILLEGMAGARHVVLAGKEAVEQSAIAGFRQSMTVLPL